MPRTRVKICGITRAEDARVAADAGSDAIGLVFYVNSPRHVEIDQARAVVATLPAFVTTVALFRNAEAEYVNAVLAAVDIDLLQFHGSESADFCRGFDRPYIKALGMLGQADIEAQAKAYPDARGLLLDAHPPGGEGGSGETFDWHSIPAAMRGDIILAGGLNPDNVFDAVSTVRPWAVDVSSGVELSRGIKSAGRIQTFINEVKRADGD